MTAPETLRRTGREAEALCEHLGRLCDDALGALAAGSTHTLLDVLAAQERLREEIEPRTRELAQARAGGTADEALQAQIARIAGSLVRARDAQLLLHEQARQAREALAGQRRALQSRTRALAGYQQTESLVSRGFTRTT